MTIIPVKIAEIRQETPTVRVLRLDLQSQEFHYKAGQWINCYAEIDNVRQVVGYSLTSSPTSKGFIELAVKISDNPVTEYIHSSAKEGDILHIEGGNGEIYYEVGMGSKVVLIAGGIGVSPLMGILRYIDPSKNASVTLLQSASSFEELIFYDEIRRMAGSNPRVKYYPFVTREEPLIGVIGGRISGESFERIGVNYNSLFYISGPDGMIPELTEYLKGRGVDPGRIKYEFWWKPEHTE
jgi:ferredoxin-NADP reductase